MKKKKIYCTQNLSADGMSGSNKYGTKMKGTVMKKWLVVTVLIASVVLSIFSFSYAVEHEVDGDGTKPPPLTDRTWTVKRSREIFTNKWGDIYVLDKCTCTLGGSSVCDCL